eukprot:scaffold34647_cov182-Amphora_coffeaeformis.AAC.7
MPHINTFSTFVQTVEIFRAFWFAKGLFQRLEEGIGTSRAGAPHDGRQRSSIVAFVIRTSHGGDRVGSDQDNGGDKLQSQGQDGLFDLGVVVWGLVFLLT